jgi:16S rRNA G966 N2-methylase RsmD
MSEGFGDDFFDDCKISATPGTTTSSMGSSPRNRNNYATFGAAAAAGGGVSSQKKNRIGKRDNGNGHNNNNNNGQAQHHQPQQQDQKKKNNNNNSNARSRSNSPMRSKSPRRGHCNKNKHHNVNCNDLHHHYNPKKDGPPDITIVVNRVDLYDSAAHIVAVAVDGPFNQQHQQQQHHLAASPYPVMPFSFVDDKNHDGRHVVTTKVNNRNFADCLVAIQRVPYSVKYVPCEDLLASHQTVPSPPERAAHQSIVPAVDNSIPNPFDKSIDKYWAQRRRLFSKFDQGIQLDSEGFFSVTPEIIADHVAHRVADLHAATSATQGWVVFDAFCGCGGNGIAFSKVPNDRIALTVCVDTDRNKLRMAAHNASLYNIPPDQIVFVECNSIFILKHCYRNGQFILDQPDLLIEAGATPPRLPSPVPTEVFEGYHIGGINMLPRRIDVVFMDPPWGGM